MHVVEALVAAGLLEVRRASANATPGGSFVPDRVRTIYSVTGVALLKSPAKSLAKQWATVPTNSSAWPV